MTTKKRSGTQAHRTPARSGSAKKAPARGAPAKKAPAKGAQSKSGRKQLLVFGGAAVAILAIAIAVASLGGTKGGAAPPEEQKYIGRLLPAGYEEPAIGQPAGIYTSAIPMTPLKPELTASTLAVSEKDLAAAKIVSFEYAKKGQRPIPMIAYVKPSGKLFVGVSFCPPCEGEGQRIEADGTLTCETCGTKRNIETQVGLSGACKLYPLDELPATVSGGKIVLQTSALDQWTPQPKDRKIGG